LSKYQSGFNVVSIFFLSSLWNFLWASSFRCQSLLSTQNNSLISSISSLSNTSSLVSIESPEVPPVVAPYRADWRPTNNRAPGEKNKFLGLLTRFCAYCRDDIKPLSIKVELEDRIVSIVGIIPKGELKDVGCGLTPIKIAPPGKRKFVGISGLQFSISVGGGGSFDSDILARISLVIYAKTNGPVRSYNEGAKVRRFVGKLPTSGINFKRVSEKPASIVVDFEMMKDDDKNSRQTLADVLNESEIVGIGFRFDATNDPLNINFSLLGDVFFISDLKKIMSQHDKKLLVLAASQLQQELLNEIPYLSSLELGRLLVALMNRHGDFALQGFSRSSIDEFDLVSPRDRSLAENAILRDPDSLKLLTRDEIITFIQDRPLLATDEVGTTGSAMKHSTYFHFPPKLLRLIVGRLYSLKRQQATVNFFNEKGAKGLISRMETLGFVATATNFVTLSELWDIIASYNKNLEGKFKIVTDIGDFGRDHFEFSHLLQLYTIVEGMSPDELAQFKKLFVAMQSSLSTFTYLWTLLFDANGSAVPSSPRYWRDLVKSN
jgi:hypothetical protein